MNSAVSPLAVGSFRHNPYAVAAVSPRPAGQSPNAISVDDCGASDNGSISPAACESGWSTTHVTPRPAVAPLPAVADLAFDECDDDNAAQEEEAEAFAPAQPMLHRRLFGAVPLFEYPAHPFPVLRCHARREQLCRLFLGQLPYHVSDMQLAWLCDAFAGGRQIFYVERIVHWRNGRQPSGCIHAYCYPQDRDAILSLNQRVLFDDCGVWVATPGAAHEQAALARYCAFLAEHKEQRAPQRPYQAMSVQVATSTYLPHLEKQRLFQQQQQQQQLPLAPARHRFAERSTPQFFLMQQQQQQQQYFEGEMF